MCVQRFPKKHPPYIFCVEKTHLYFTLFDCFVILTKHVQSKLENLQMYTAVPLDIMMYFESYRSF